LLASRNEEDLFIPHPKFMADYALLGIKEQCETPMVALDGHGT
jgi:hypothetical protein